MTRFERQSFIHVLDRNSSRSICDMEFSRCYFESCRLSISRTPALRTTVRNVKLVNCEQRGCAIEAAVLDAVTVDGLKTNGLLQTWGAAFRHVTLKGRIGRIMLSNVVATGLATPEEQRAFDAANAAFYASTDWALDLIEAEFEECDIRGVPAALIRRDADTQVVVTREAAITGRWRRVDLSGTYWATAIEFLVESQLPDTVLVAPKRHRNFRHMLDGLRKLRDCGVAAPD